VTTGFLQGCVTDEVGRPRILKPAGEGPQANESSITISMTAQTRWTEKFRLRSAGERGQLFLSTLLQMSPSLSVIRSVLTTGCESELRVILERNCISKQRQPDQEDCCSSDLVMTKEILDWSSLAIIILSLLACCNGCDSSHGNAASGWKDEVAKWKGEGWVQEETLGTTGEYAMSSFIKSDTSRSLTAFWVVKGVRSEKKYPQTEKKYLILTFSKSDGDSFAVVLSKAAGQ